MLGKPFSIHQIPGSTSREKFFIEKILEDKNFLVKTSIGPAFTRALLGIEKNEQGNDVVLIWGPEKFYSLTLKEKIIYFSELSVQHGRIISEIFEWGLANNALCEDLLVILLDECVHNFKKTNTYGNSLPLAIDGMEILWKLVIALGKKNKHIDIDLYEYDAIKGSSSYSLASHMKADEILNEIIICALIESLPIVICGYISICNKKLSEEIINQLDSRSRRKLVQEKYPLLYFDMTERKIKHGEATEEKLDQKLHPSQPEVSLDFKKSEITKKNLRNTYWASLGVFLLFGYIVSIFNFHSNLWLLLIYGFPILMSVSITVDYIKQNIAKKFDQFIDKISNKIKSEIKFDHATTEKN